MKAKNLMTDAREVWLDGAVKAIRPLFKEKGYMVPANVRATCGFPSKSALPSKRQRIGECWSDSASDGKVFEIFISPVVHNTGDALGVLTHELVHATVGLKHGHKTPFKRCALAIGLEGKMTSTVPGPELSQFLNGVASNLGQYPHKRLNVSSAPKNGGTRLLKCECSECGYTVRVTAKWLAVGEPICPTCGDGMAADV